MLNRAPYIVLIAAALLLSTCDHRPSESAFYGTWIHDPAPGDWIYWRFQPDGRVEILADQGRTIAFTGKWYAGGPNLYLRFRPEIAERALIIWHIVNVSADEFRVQVWRDGEVMTYKRVTLSPPNASNQSLEPTAGRRVVSSCFTRGFPMGATLALASGGSAHSR